MYYGHTYVLFADRRTEHVCVSLFLVFMQRGAFTTSLRMCVCVSVCLCVHVSVYAHIQSVVSACAADELCAVWIQTGTASGDRGARAAVHCTVFGQVGLCAKTAFLPPQERRPRRSFGYLLMHIIAHFPARSPRVRPIHPVQSSRCTRTHAQAHTVAHNKLMPLHRMGSKPCYHNYTTEARPSISSTAFRPKTIFGAFAQNYTHTAHAHTRTQHSIHPHTRSVPFASHQAGPSRRPGEPIQRWCGFRAVRFGLVRCGMVWRGVM